MKKVNIIKNTFWVLAGAVFFHAPLLYAAQPGILIGSPCECQFGEIIMEPPRPITCPNGSRGLKIKGAACETGYSCTVIKETEHHGQENGGYKTTEKNGSWVDFEKTDCD